MGRWFATLLGLSIWLCAPPGVLFAQQGLPLRDDDLAYARKLSAAGFQDLAIDLYERLSARAGITPKEKQDIGLLIVEAYRGLAAKEPDLATRSKYNAKADEILKGLVKDLPAVTPEIRYKQAQVLQDEGRSAARAVREEANAERKKALIADGAKKFDECMTMLEELTKEMNLRGDAALKGARDMEAAGAAAKPFRDMASKAEHQRAWTPYYKAQLWASDEADYKTCMSQAVQLLSTFIENHPTEMLMLSARYGRGLAYKLLGKRDEALRDFNDIVTMIDAQEVIIPEVMPLKARCVVNWAELSAEGGQVDEALAALDRMLRENPALETDKELKQLALLTKAKVLAAKARKMKDQTNPGAIQALWQEALDLLGQVIEMGEPYMADAMNEQAKYVEESGLKTLGPTVRLTLAQGLIGEKKYKDAITELRKIIDDAAVTPDAAFKAERMLAVALRYNGEMQESVKEFERLFRLHSGRQPKKELAKVFLEYCKTLGLQAEQAKDKPELDKAYVDSLKRLAVEYPDTPEGIDAPYYYAEAKKQRADTVEKWQETAKAYTEVKPESKFYAKARYMEGLCWYNVYRIYSQRKEQKTDPAQQALKKALDILRNLFDKMPAPQPGDDWPVEAANTLAEVHLDLGQPDDAFGVADMVMKKYPALAANDPRFMATVVNIYIRLGKLTEAEKLLEDMSGKGAEPAVLMRAFLTLGDAYQKKGEDAGKAKDLEGAKANFKKAGELFARGLPLVKDDDKDVLRLLGWVATRGYMVKDYETCIKAIERIEKLYKDANREADPPLWKLRLQKAQCYKAMNLWPPEALDLLKDLEKQYPNVASIKFLRASVYESRNEWEEALKIWDELEGGLPPGGDDWWDVKYHRALCNYKLGRKDRANEIIEGQRAVSPDMKTPENKERFDKLWQEFNK